MRRALPAVLALLANASVGEAQELDPFQAVVAEGRECMTVDRSAFGMAPFIHCKYKLSGSDAFEIFNIGGKEVPSFHLLAVTDDYYVTVSVGDQGCVHVLKGGSAVSIDPTTGLVYAGHFCRPSPDSVGIGKGL